MYRDNRNEANGRRCQPCDVDLLPYQSMLRGIARRHLRQGDDEDLVQEVLMRALRAESLPCEGPRLRSFLGVVARNVCVDWRRRRSRTPTMMPLDEAELPSPDTGCQASAARLEVEGVLAALPTEVRAALLMHYRDQLSHSEIARRLGTTPGAIAVRLHRARQRARARR